MYLRELIIIVINYKKGWRKERLCINKKGVMSGIWIFIWVVALIRLADYVLSKEPEPVKAEKTTSIPQPTSNLDKRPILKCYHLLNLKSGSTFTLDDVYKAYFKRLQEVSEQREKGIAPKHELKEYQSAKIVMTDFYKYGALRN